MQHETDNEELIITDSEITFDKIYNKPYFPQQYAEEIKNANVLIIPCENMRSGVALSFPETTSEFLQYLQDNSQDGVITDIAIDDENYQKLALHSAVITIATCIIKYAVWPIATSIIATFIYEQVKKHHRSENDMSADLTIYVEKDGVTKKVHYKGPAGKVRSVLNAPIFDEEDVTD